MKNFIIKKLGCFLTLSLFFTNLSYAEFDDFSDAVNVSAKVAKEEKQEVKNVDSIVTKSNDATSDLNKKANNTINTISNNTSYNDYNEEEHIFTREDAINELTEKFGNEQDAQKVVDTIGFNNYQNFKDTIGLNNVNNLMRQIGGVDKFPSLMNQLGKGGADPTQNLSTLIHQVGINNMGSLIKGVGGVQNLDTLRNAVGGYGQVGSLIRGINGVGNLHQFLGDIGGLNNLPQFISNVNGVENIGRFASNIGGIGNLSSFLNTIGGFNNMSSFMSNIGGFGNMSSFMNSIGGFGNFSSFFTSIGGLGNLSSLFSQMGGFGNFSNFMYGLGNFSNFQGLMTGLGGNWSNLNSLSSFLGGVGGLGNLTNFSGLITGLYGGMSGNLFQSFMGQLRPDFGNVLGSIGSIGNLSSLLNGLGFNGGFGQFFQWIQRFFRSFGISLGGFAQGCSNLGSTITCDNQSLTGILSDFTDSRFPEISNPVSVNGNNPTANMGAWGIGDIPSDVTSIDSYTGSRGGCPNGRCPYARSLKTKDIQTIGSFYKNLIPNRKIIYDPNLKKKNLAKSLDTTSSNVYNKAQKGGADKANSVSEEYYKKVNQVVDDSEKQKNFYEVKNQLSKYDELPFAKGNRNADEYRSKEESYVEEKEFPMCNKDLEQDKIKLDKLTAKGTGVNTIPYPDPCDGYISYAWEDHTNGYFIHRAYNLVPAGPHGTCYEEHRLKPGVEGIRKVGECEITISGKDAVPFRFQKFPVLFFCVRGCRTWRIISDKVEYYFPTHKITLSKDPLYSRYLDSQTGEKMFKRYKKAITKELQSQEMAKSTNEILETYLDKNKKKKNSKSTASNNNKDVKLQPDDVADTAFLGQINRGYARFFDFPDIEEKYSGALWGETLNQQVLPHVTAKKEYWGTDFDKNMESEFSENPTKANLALFTKPGLNYGSPNTNIYSQGNPKNILATKHKDLLKDPWNALKRDGRVGGSYQFHTQVKADPELHGKGTDIDSDRYLAKNTYVLNKNAYGVGSVSSLESLTPTGNSDFILQTLLRAQNLFIADVDPIRTGGFGFIRENKGKSVLTEFVGQGNTCDYDAQADHQMIPQNPTNFATVSTRAGQIFYITTLTPPKQGNRQTYKAMYDLFHAPVIKEDNGQKFPKSFNEDFNKEVQNILEKNGERPQSSNQMPKGDMCYKMSDLMNNNLDFNVINTLTSKYGNTSTLANKGEISFTQYTLFTGAIAFPGMTCKFWWNGIGLAEGLQGKGHCIEKGEGSKAVPKLGAAEFRLF